MPQYKEMAKNIVCNNLGAGHTGEALFAMHEIRSGNDQLLLEHIKALKNIFEKAIKEIEGDKR